MENSERGKIENQNIIEISEYNDKKELQMRIDNSMKLDLNKKQKIDFQNLNVFNTDQRENESINQTDNQKQNEQYQSLNDNQISVTFFHHTKQNNKFYINQVYSSDKNSQIIYQNQTKHDYNLEKIDQQIVDIDAQKQKEKQKNKSFSQWRKTKNTQQDNQNQESISKQINKSETKEEYKQQQKSQQIIQKLTQDDININNSESNSVKQQQFEQNNNIDQQFNKQIQTSENESDLKNILQSPKFLQQNFSKNKIFQTQSNESNQEGYQIKINQNDSYLSGQRKVNYLNLTIESIPKSSNTFDQTLLNRQIETYSIRIFNDDELLQSLKVQKPQELFTERNDKNQFYNMLQHQQNNETQLQIADMLNNREQGNQPNDNLLNQLLGFEQEIDINNQNSEITENSNFDDLPSILKIQDQSQKTVQSQIIESFDKIEIKQKNFINIENEYQTEQTENQKINLSMTALHNRPSDTIQKQAKNNRFGSITSIGLLQSASKPAKQQITMVQQQQKTIDKRKSNELSFNNSSQVLYQSTQNRKSSFNNSNFKEIEDILKSNTIVKQQEADANLRIAKNLYKENFPGPKIIQYAGKIDFLKRQKNQVDNYATVGGELNNKFKEQNLADIHQKLSLTKNKVAFNQNNINRKSIGSIFQQKNNLFRKSSVSPVTSPLKSTYKMVLDNNLTILRRKKISSPKIMSQKQSSLTRIQDQKSKFIQHQKIIQKNKLNISQATRYMQELDISQKSIGLSSNNKVSQVSKQQQMIHDWREICKIIDKIPGGSSIKSRKTFTKNDVMLIAQQYKKRIDDLEQIFKYEEQKANKYKKELFVQYEELKELKVEKKYFQEQVNRIPELQSLLEMHDQKLEECINFLKNSMIQNYVCLEFNKDLQILMNDLNKKKLSQFQNSNKMQNQSYQDKKDIQINNQIIQSIIKLQKDHNIFQAQNTYENNENSNRGYQNGYFENSIENIENFIFETIQYLQNFRKEEKVIKIDLENMSSGTDNVNEDNDSFKIKNNDINESKYQINFNNIQGKEKLIKKIDMNQNDIEYSQYHDSEINKMKMKSSRTEIVNGAYKDNHNSSQKMIKNNSNVNILKHNDIEIQSQIPTQPKINFFDKYSESKPFVNINKIKQSKQSIKSSQKWKKNMDQSSQKKNYEFILSQQYSQKPQVISTRMQSEQNGGMKMMSSNKKHSQIINSSSNIIEHARKSRMRMLSQQAFHFMNNLGHVTPFQSSNTAYQLQNKLSQNDKNMFSNQDPKNRQIGNKTMLQYEKMYKEYTSKKLQYSILLQKYEHKAKRVMELQDELSLIGRQNNQIETKVQFQEQIDLIEAQLNAYAQKYQSLQNHIKFKQRENYQQLQIQQNLQNQIQKLNQYIKSQHEMMQSKDGFQNFQTAVISLFNNQIQQENEDIPQKDKKVLQAVFGDGFLIENKMREQLLIYKNIATFLINDALIKIFDFFEKQDKLLLNILKQQPVSLYNINKKSNNESDFGSDSKNQEFKQKQETFSNKQKVHQQPEIIESINLFNEKDDLQNSDNEKSNNTYQDKLLSKRQIFRSQTPVESGSQSIVKPSILLKRNTSQSVIRTFHQILQKQQLFLKEIKSKTQELYDNFDEFKDFIIDEQQRQNLLKHISVGHVSQLPSQINSSQNISGDINQSQNLEVKQQIVIMKKRQKQKSVDLPKQLNKHLLRNKSVQQDIANQEQKNFIQDKQKIDSQLLQSKKKVLEEEKKQNGFDFSITDFNQIQNNTTSSKSQLKQQNNTFVNRQYQQIIAQSNYDQDKFKVHESVSKNKSKQKQILDRKKNQK